MEDKIKILLVSFLIVMLFFFFIGCETENLPTNLTKSSASIELFENDVEKIEVTEKDMSILANYSIEKSTDKDQRNALADEVLLKYFAMAIAKSLKHPGICQLLKDKIGEKFDGDFDVLWDQIKKNQISGRDLRELVDSRFSDRTRQVLSVNKIEEVPLLQVSLPVNYDNWDGKSTILVAYTPLTTDDMEWKEIYAYDADMKEHILNAKTEPDFPVMVVGINERVDPITMALYKAYEKISIEKESVLTSDNPLPPDEYKILVCDFSLYDDHEPWTKGDPEIYVKARYPWQDGVWKRTDFPDVNKEKLYEEEDYSWLPKSVFTTTEGFSDYVRFQVWEDDNTDSDDLVENLWHLDCPGCGESYYYFDPSNVVKIWHYGETRDADLSLKYKPPFSLP